MKTIIMMRGIQGSGKSFWAKEFVKNNNNVIRISNDELRLMFFNRQFDTKDTRAINYYRELIIEDALNDGWNVIVDAMNLGDKHESQYRTLAERHCVEFQIKDFSDVPLSVCIERDAKREFPIGKKVITQTYNKFIRKDPPKIEHDPNLPNALIVDIDGTLAIHQPKIRSPYQEELAGQDTVNEAVKDVVKLYHECGTKIIICSGRDAGRGFAVLKQWLMDNEIPWDKIFMRVAGDSRKDSIIKREIYENEIKGKYNIKFVLDDRDQVIELWRIELGLPTFQVNYGDF